LSCGRVLSASGEHGRAIAAIREGIDAYRATGERISLPILLATLAEAHAAAGDGAAALACGGGARATTDSAGPIHHDAELRPLHHPPCAHRPSGAVAHRAPPWGTGDRLLPRPHPPGARARGALGAAAYDPQWGAAATRAGSSRRAPPCPP